MRIVGHGEVTNSMGLMKIAFVLLELLTICLIVSFLLPYFPTFHTCEQSDCIFANDLRFILPMITFLFATLLLAWSKKAPIDPAGCS